ncbi:unnamed protein product [Diatraea saccharalis]|uniref:Peptidase A2 domain-containing protein n=1 Tax=Diatraea saccharalis TaxID=40085 RepID=A0A9N9R8L8_9NEOP|nr:unnamed protein product [Diatraea saccharalis]
MARDAIYRNCYYLMRLQRRTSPCSKTAWNLLGRLRNEFEELCVATAGELPTVSSLMGLLDEICRRQLIASPGPKQDETMSTRQRKSPTAPRKNAYTVGCGFRNCLNPTVTLGIRNINGGFEEARALLDTGASVSAIREALVNRLRLHRQTSSMEIIRIGNNTVKTPSSKVAEFKEKIAKAQLERASADVPPPALALPTRLAAPPPTHPPPPVATSVAAGVAGMAGGGGLPQDLQEALDIIFPSDVKLKPELQQPDLFLPPFPMPLGFPPLGLMQPQMPPGMFGFDMNAPLFQPQLYDTHVPLVPGNKPRPQQNKRPNNAPANNQKGDKRLQTQKQQNAQTQHNPAPAQSQSQPETKENGTVARKKEELDELAMLGIDASDVGAGM